MSLLREKFSRLEKTSWLRLFVREVYNNPVLGFLKFFYFYFYCLYISYRIFGFGLKPKVFFTGDVFPVHIKKNKAARVTYNCKVPLIFESWCGGRNTSALILESNSHFHLENEFSLGDGVKVVLSKNANLNVLGALNSSSGITAESVIIVCKSITLGYDTILSWNCYVTDSSQHKINGSEKVESVFIGNNVWLSEGVTVGPGVTIGNGSVIGAKSFVNKSIGEKVFAAGCPAKVISVDIYWER